jgi:polynucleotide 5'-hydroxyl-kinase GRC3/NOL9
MFSFFAFLFNAGACFDMLIEMLRYICSAIVVQICIIVQSKNIPDGVFWLDDWQAGPKVYLS